jgi:hypothetical protein
MSHKYVRNPISKGIEMIVPQPTNPVLVLLRNDLWVVKSPIVHLQIKTKVILIFPSQLILIEHN